MLKWQKELQSFLGIKAGIILEGNVYDEYPLYSGEIEDFTPFEFDKLDQTLHNLAEMEGSGHIFFIDPSDGFYCYRDSVDLQREALMPLFEGYQIRETLRESNSRLCILPIAKEGCAQERADQFRQIWMSEIVRRFAAEEIEQARESWGTIVLNFASRLEQCNLNTTDSNEMFLNLLMATKEGNCAKLLSHCLIFVVDKYNDLPTWFYLNNPNIKTITIGAPDRATRRLFTKTLYGPLQPFSILAGEHSAAGEQFIAETEGMQCQELQQILRIAHKKHIMPDEINSAVQLYKYGVLDNPWDGLGNEIITRIAQILESRVLGQEDALKKVHRVAVRAVKGLSGLQHSNSSRKPRGILFFAGPSGVGKTETAKALAQSIFGDEEACIRFDMSEYRLEHSDQKLFGAPPGYVGYEGGGQLTNEVKKRPFSILLFDEIEKASPTILDKFLQILEDGRMTDNQGNTVYFGESIIIFTSNIGLTSIERDSAGEARRVPTITIQDPLRPDTPEFRASVTQTLREGVKDYFIQHGRPELLNRLGEDNIVVFHFINVDAAIKICTAKLRNICENIQENKRIRIFTEEIEAHLQQLAVQERANGGRGIGNMLERVFLNPLAEVMTDMPAQTSALRCRVDSSQAIVFEVM